ncbi:MAG TPA: hypothetical protein VKZ92_09295, partial [Pseudohongiella sp.]|nr:hypothetical protein [Pseudohongiella sp.]
AHGLITWAISTMLAAAIFTSTLGAVFSGGANAGVQLGSSAIEAAASGASAVSDSYFTDALLRPNNTQASPADEDIRAELSTILLHSLAQGELSAEDSQYLNSVVARYTGISTAEANARVQQIYERAQQTAAEMEMAAREAADVARRTAAYAAIWMVVALLCGAFTASLLATIGGRQRDFIS